MNTAFMLAKGYFGVMSVLYVMSNEDVHALICLVGFLIAYGFDEVIDVLRRSS